MTSKHLMAPEPEQMFPNGAAVLFRFNDMRQGVGTVLSYDRLSGEFKIQTKNRGIITRFWAGVRSGGAGTHSADGSA